MVEIWSTLIRWHADAPEDAFVSLHPSREDALEHVRTEMAETIKTAEADGENLTFEADLLDYLYGFGVYVRIDEHQYHGN